LEIRFMTFPAAPVRLVLAATVLTALALPAPALAQATVVALASHRAVYDLKLSTTRGKRSMNAVRGRILYDFSGNACEAMRCNSARSPSSTAARAR
jgi:hypothetical protein